jgi:hypothetical protein
MCKENSYETMKSPLDNIPEEWKNYAERAFEIAACIKTYDQEKYEVEVEGNSIRIVVPITR